MRGVAALGRDVTALARLGRLDPVVGRESEMDELLRVLCRRTKSNPLLLGHPGVGKTALVEGLALALVEGAVPAGLQGRPLWELQLGSLLAGTQFRGDLEKRVEDFLLSAKAERSLVFIDEIHLLVVAGRGSGMDAANLLKPVLARAEVPCIGATTPEEAQQMFRLDPALERRFQSIAIEEPGADTVRLILRAARPRLEAHHGVRISDAALEAALDIATAQTGRRRNPDHALDLLEDACARVQLQAAKRLHGKPEGASVFQELERDLRAAEAALDLERHVQARGALQAFGQKSNGMQEAREIVVSAADVVRA